MIETKTPVKSEPVAPPTSPASVRQDAPEPHEKVERQQGDREKEPGVKEKQQS